jgi:hypothetical protein
MQGYTCTTRVTCAYRGIAPVLRSWCLSLSKLYSSNVVSVVHDECLLFSVADGGGISESDQHQSHAGRCHHPARSSPNGTSQHTYRRSPAGDDKNKGHAGKKCHQIRTPSPISEHSVSTSGITPQAASDADNGSKKRKRESDDDESEKNCNKLPKPSAGHHATVVRQQSSCDADESDLSDDGDCEGPGDICSFQTQVRTLLWRLFVVPCNDW